MRQGNYDTGPPHESKRPAPPQDRPSPKHPNVDSIARCTLCHRPLRARLSVTRRRGPICWQRRVTEAAPI